MYNLKRACICLRGGRLTKVAGKVASCAPFLGTASIAGLVGIGVSVSPARAANECGPDAAGPTTISCPSGTFAGGITYTPTEEFTLELNDGGIVVQDPGVFVNGTAANTGNVTTNATLFGSITTSTDDRSGIRTRTEGSGNVATTLGSGAITTTGQSARGISARTLGSGTATVQIDGGNISTTGSFSHAGLAEVDNAASTATASATLTDGLIDTTGASARAIQSVNSGLGASSTLISGGTVTTAGEFAHGAISTITNTTSTASATTSMSGGSVTTTGDSARGIETQNAGLGVSTATVTGGNISTDGEFAHGAVASIDNALNTQTATASISGGTINTGTGAATRAVFAQNLGLGAATATMDGGALVTGGSGGFGLNSTITNAANTANSTVTLTFGTITTTGANGRGLSTDTNGSGLAQASVVGGAVTTSGASARAVQAEARGAGNANVSIADGTIMTGGTFAHGGLALVSNATGAGTATTTMADGSVTTTANNARGLIAQNNGLGAATSGLQGGTINTQGTNARGVEALINNAASSAAAAASVTGGSITTTGANGDAVRAQNNGTGTATATLANGTINTAGAGARGLQARTSGSGAATATIQAGTIDTQGTFGAGVQAVAAGTGAAIANVDGGTITTTNANARGTFANVTGAASTALASTTMTTGTVTTSGADSYGLVAWNDGLGATSSTLTGGSVVTSGANAHGILSRNDEAANNAVAQASVSGGTIASSGTNADGVRVQHNGTGNYIATISGGTVTGGAGNGAAVHTIGSGIGTIDIASAATLDGSTSGVAIRDGDVDSDGVDEAAASGNATLTTAGTVTGDAVLGLGNDVINLTGGTLTGSIYGDDIAAAAADGDDTFNWSGGVLSGGFFGQNGSDDAMVSGSVYAGQVLDGGDDVSTADGFIDTLTLAGANVTANGANIINWETVTVQGGTLNITDGALTVGSDAGTGLALTSGAVLDGGGAFALTGNMTINTTSRFVGTGAGTGVYSVSGNVQNSGVITTQDGVVGDVLTIGGDYTGGGSILVDVDTVTDTADLIAISGDASGTTDLIVTVLDPDTATGNDVEVITVAGSVAPSAFRLATGPVTAGAYDYNLAFDAGSFVLRAGASVNATGAVYEAAPATLFGFNRLPTLEQRVGQRQWAGKELVRDPLEPSKGAWLRFHGDRLETKSNTGTKIDRDGWGLQVGYDFEPELRDDGRWVFGITAQYGAQDASVSNISGEGNIDSDGYGLGLTATWYGNGGFYADAQGQINWLSTDFFSSSAGSLATSEDSTAYALSLEIGQRYETSQNGTLVPQAQLNWGRVDGADFVDSQGNGVDLDSNSSLFGRIGLAYEYENNDERSGDREKAYIIGNILHDFSGNNSVDVGATSLSSSSDTTWAEIGLGGSVTWDENKTVYGEASYRTSISDSSGDNNGLSLTAGLRIQW
ncbi:autotransporter outer membrane beta-barrel domain-containing protein [uncultured Tateyamaria sp.]|uniref:autotransporter outer membrane beta-barrel domain-containing protein n=1 Tax=uncultured Tateyamaria sp. TaxID=455651 RepID=UPI002628E71A|nr:autotransporter outer membrane beta-barrel domain-containing protein [uncultured Tateyamaria sp.]